MNEAFAVGVRTFPQKLTKGAPLGPHSGSELSADFTPFTPPACLADVVLGPGKWRDETGFEWVQMASGRWYRVDNSAVHWDG